MSLKKIQELTGYSPSTISRVLNKKDEFKFSESTRRTILETADKIDYRPNSVARSLRLNKTMIIGLIVSDIKNSFFGELASWIEARLRQHGYSTILYDTNEDPGIEELYFKVLTERMVDGIIITPAHSEEWDFLRNTKEKIPVVLVDRTFSQTDLPWVTGQNELAAEKLTTELIRLGYSRIAYLGGPVGTYINQERYRGYARALDKAGLNVDDSLIVFQGYSVEDGRQMMDRILSSKSHFNAVLCVNNLVFLGVMSILQEQEHLAEDQLKIAAFDIRQYCSLFKRPILCANQDVRRMADSAVEILIDRIDNRNSKNNQLMIPISLEKHCIDESLVPGV